MIKNERCSGEKDIRYGGSNKEKQQYYTLYKCRLRISNKFSVGISTRSIHILRKAAVNVSDEERLMLDKILGVEPDEYLTVNHRRYRNIDASIVRPTYPSDTYITEEIPEDQTDVDFRSAETDPLYVIRSDVSSGRTDESGLGLFQHALEKSLGL